MVASYRQPSSKQSNMATRSASRRSPSPIDATSDATPVFYAQTYTTHSSIDQSYVDRRRRRRRSSLLLLQFIFPELLEEPLARQFVVIIEQPA